MSENVVFLKFKNPDATNAEWLSFIACKHCRNKTFTMMQDDEKRYPFLKCAACGHHCGSVGWVENDADDKAE